MMGLLLLSIVMGSISYLIMYSGQSIYDLPTVRQLEERDKLEEYALEGMDEVNKFLAPYTTLDDGQIEKELT